MDYEIYKNSTCVIDKSGVQALLSLSSDEKFQPLNFFDKNNIELISSSASLEEFTFQNYKNCSWTLFTGSIISETITSLTAGSQNINFVLSQTEPSITFKELEPSGLPIHFVESSTLQLSLWDTAPFLTNPKNFVDKNIILTARNKKKNKNIWILTDDAGIIKHIERFEMIKYLRPVDILKWMVKDNFISLQKGVSIFKKWKSNNWTDNIQSFKGI